jgi:hypothetical protein
MVTTISLGSVQVGEGYRYSISTNGGSTFTAATDVFPANDGTDNTTLAINMPAANLVIKFEKTVTVPAGLDDDYTVRTVTTSFTPPSTIWCSPGFWKTHLDAWSTTLQNDLYNDNGPYPVNPQTFLGYNFGKKVGSSNPTMVVVISNPSIYGGPATNNVASFISNQLFGTPITANPTENCPDILPID